jgi:hypothetical protein
MLHRLRDWWSSADKQGWLIVAFMLGTIFAWMIFYDPPIAD